MQTSTKIMNDQHSIQPLLGDDIPQAPPVRVPSLDQLRREVGRRRQRRKLASAAALGSVALAIVAGFAFRFGPGDQPETLPLRPEAAAPVSVVDADDRPPRDQRVVAMSDPGVRVYARVLDHLPVFGMNEETKLIRHVGWIESERTIPVDLERLSADQQRTLKAVLDDSQPQAISL